MGGYNIREVAADFVARLNDGTVLVVEAKTSDQDDLLGTIDSVKKQVSTYAIMLAAVSGDKVNFVAAVSDDLIAKGLKAGDWIRETAKVAGGGGGGRPQVAQAGGKDPSKLDDALNVARDFADKALS